jgi:hypothetical protein
VVMQRKLSEAALLGETKSKRQPRYLPTPEQIRAACDEMEVERRKRRELMGEHEYDGAWEPPAAAGQLLTGRTTTAGRRKLASCRVRRRQ